MRTLLSRFWYNSGMADNTRRTNKKVAVLIDISAGASARDVLSGIFKFVNAGHDWSLRLIQLPSETPLSAIGNSIDRKIDGLIVTSAADDAANQAIAKAGVPIVFVDVRHPLFERREASVSFVRNDNEGIGALGARYLANLGGFNSFGFVPDVDGRAWSKLREKAFVQEVKANRGKPHVFGNGSKQMDEDRRNLVVWLRRLPKPAAVMAAFDYRAVQVREACAEAKLHIPEQVALLGVDNDELLCLSANPPLSSVRADHVAEGFQAAAELHRLFRLGVRAKRREIFCRTHGVVERESTKAGPPTAALIRRAVAFIDANARSNLRVGTVADALGVSRRLLEKRFREVRGETLHGYILAKRLSIVRHLLKTTRRTSAKIAAECGFPNANALSHIFARETGLSMRDYRSSAK